MIQEGKEKVGLPLDLPLKALVCFFFCFIVLLLNGVETYIDIGMSGTFSEWM
jgi:hypothetical protein